MLEIDVVIGREDGKDIEYEIVSLVIDHSL
ncbi:hypothetical protein CLV99_0631 [Sphingobacterium yanglingense]|uniref:Uncharacterized protein n=1 Tax=Sphingobacterium yanglingense TaxID=1437280 RepID=A0A4V3DE08_9SPHI|nr:hypothetical protein CLV99_0631 [Sphingobacterium yanglingense]